MDTNRRKRIQIFTYSYVFVFIRFVGNPLYPVDPALRSTSETGVRRAVLDIPPSVSDTAAMPKDLAVVLNNGGINSAVVTALAAQKHRVVMVMVETGWAIEPRLASAFEQQAAHFKPFREHVLPMPFLAPLLAESAGTSEAVDPRALAPVTPRLIELLPIVGVAMRLAIHYQATALYLGLRLGISADDMVRATEFGQVWNELVQLTCDQPELNVEMPLLELDPWQVVDLGVQVSTPFERTWSCQADGNEPCWACRGCRAREAAFQQAAKADPLRAVRK